MIKKLNDNLHHSFKNLFQCFLKKINELKNYLSSTRYKLKNLTETNLALGKYHLFLFNLNDAIVRFKIVTNFLDKGNKEANYWLGWCYYLKNKHNVALDYLAQAEDKVGLSDFLKNYNKVDTIPDKIWEEYRNLVNEKYVNYFYNDDIHLPYRLVQKIFPLLQKNLPTNPHVLELGSNIGLLGYEIAKKIPSIAQFVGVESSELMIESSENYYANMKIYDKLIHSSVSEYLNNANKEQFDLIISLCGFTFTKDLESYFQKVTDKLQSGGYFAFCLPIAEKNKISMKMQNFTYQTDFIHQVIAKNSLEVLLEEELSLKKDLRYFLCLCRV